MNFNHDLGPYYEACGPNIDDVIFDMCNFFKNDRRNIFKDVLIHIIKESIPKDTLYFGSFKGYACFKRLEIHLNIIQNLELYNQTISLKIIKNRLNNSKDLPYLPIEIWIIILKHAKFNYLK